LVDLSTEFNKLQNKYEAEKQELEAKGVFEEKISSLQQLIGSLKSEKTELVT
jgi:flagellar capping protein FliD